MRGWREGLALGAALAAAEIVVGYLSGGWFPARWWPAILAVDVALGALSALAASLVERAWPAAATRTRPAFVVLAFACAAVAVNHEVLPGRAGLGPLPVATAALALAGSAAGGLVAGRRSAPALPFFLVGGLALAGRLSPRGGLASAALFLAVTFACVAGGAWLARRAPAGRGFVAGAWAAAFAVAVAGAWGLLGPRPGRPDFRDRPQPPAPPGRGTRASVVLVVLDSVRAASVSAYGQATATTPRLDALAREGLLFADALTPAPWTVPAHASLFTGLSPSRHGAGVDAAGGLRPLAPAELSLAEILAAEGYTTAGFSANRAVSPAFGLDQGFRHFDSLPAREHGFAYEPLVRRLEGRLDGGLLARAFPRRNRSAAEINERVRRWLRRGEGPYFLFVNFMEAHGPHRPEPRAGYDDALRAVDRGLGQLLDDLRALAGGDDAWIVVTADHGESLGEHGLGHGCGLHHEVLHVPLVVRPPRSRGGPRGLVDRRPVMLTDVLPLLLQGLELPIPAGLDGQPPGGERAFRVAEATFPPSLCPSPREGGPRQAILDGRFKLIVGGAAEELYDRQADPAEASNVAAARAEEAARLGAWLAAWRQRALSGRARPAPAPDPEREQRLRALGYLP